MILYFSGTGNSGYVANRIAKAIEDEVINLFEKIRLHDYASIHSQQPWVIVTPTYGWRIPRMIHEWLKKTELTGSQDIYFIMTCGGNIGNAGSYLNRLCLAKHMNYLGCFPIVMPENYLAMYPTPTKEEALQIIEFAEKDIDAMIDTIRNKLSITPISVTLKDRLRSSIVNDLYYPALVHAKKFQALDSCITCGLCTTVCPLNNIHIEQDKPVWGKTCTHCMACICRCPKEAIEYGTTSKGQPRYICPKE